MPWKLTALLNTTHHSSRYNYNTGYGLWLVGHRKPCLQGLGSSQLADRLVNENNQGPFYVKLICTCLD